MKKIYLVFISFTIFFSCSTEDQVIPATCSPTSVTMFDESFTRLTFGTSDNGQQITKTSVHDDTDSVIVYDYAYAGNLESITRREDGESKIYTADFNGSTLEKLSTNDPISGKSLEEIRFTYSGNNIMTYESWIVAPSGTLYQIAHTAYSYNSRGDLVSSEFYLDVIMLFTLAFEQEPTISYAPSFFGSSVFEYGQELAPNPLKGVLFFENSDAYVMENVPIKVTEKDKDGNVSNTEDYTLTFDDNGNPIKATAGAISMEAIYTCQ
jgi:hypothetical protein